MTNIFQWFSKHLEKIKCMPNLANVHFIKHIHYLVHVISEEGIVVDPNKIKVIMESSVTKDVVEIKSLMGIMGYYRRLIEGFSK